MQAFDLNKEFSLDVSALMSRTRWDGILSDQEIHLCKQHGISIGYDCSQQGWVVYNEEEAFDQLARVDQIGESVKENSSGVIESALHKLDTVLDQYEKPMSGAAALKIVNKVHSDARVSDDLIAQYQAYSAMLAKLPRVLNKNTALCSYAELSYRPWCKTDSATYCSIMGNKKVWQFLPEDAPEPFTEELAAQLIDLANVNSDQETLAIIFNGEIIGQIRLLFNNNSQKAKTAEVVYMLGEACWGKGLMTKVLKDFIGRAFKERGLDYIYAWIKPENTGSLKAAKNAGFVEDTFSRMAQLAQANQRAGFARYLCFNSIA